MSESQGELLGDYPGEVPLGVAIDFTHVEDYLPGRWVTIVDQSRKPIILSDIRVYGSKSTEGGLKDTKLWHLPKALPVNFAPSHS